eukprot:CAMPEP_0119283828 /NCGR_PEP_ID=MMETSP1329-20130426/29251_1 /TAXON_ID=114041 /ORGANISM="Genus nov. species nov., Strain RCC1024" /LENGTH=43 /DNA_ID= /DNA_START= /DNA_END= /DNA_ORIENTATION=
MGLTMVWDENMTGRDGTSTCCAPPRASRLRRLTTAWRTAQAVM